jgi:hypothetical protein
MGRDPDRQIAVFAAEKAGRNSQNRSTNDSFLSILTVTEHGSYWKNGNGFHADQIRSFDDGFLVA